MIFDCASGDTHALDPMTTAVFRACRDSRVTPAELLEAVGATFPGRAIAQLEAEALLARDRLVQLGLLDSRSQ